MAIFNDYVNTKLQKASGRQRVNSWNAQGGRVTSLMAHFDVAAADDDGSIYRVFANIPATAVLRDFSLACDAIAGATSYDFGLYLPLGGTGQGAGTVVNKNILMSAKDISAGISRGSAADALAAVDIANSDMALWELVNAVTPGTYTIQNFPRAFDLCLTANTVGAAAGTILMRGNLFLAS